MLLAGVTAARAAAEPQQDAQAPPRGIFGPPPPIPPAVVARDDTGVTARAVRVDGPLRIDGVLDEPVYTSVQAISDFIQNDPAEGEPATEKTEVWLLFDRDNVYVVARCWETRPDRIVASEMRRDNVRIVRDDNFAWSFDTFYDRRNVVLFEVSAVGGRLDAQLTNESQPNIDWNPVWDVSVGRIDGGWVMEAALPFKSLRYRGKGPQVWGFQARRVNRWKNESSYLTPLSAAQGLRGHFRASLAATLVGIDAPPASRLFEVKPYGIADLTTSTVATPPVSNDIGRDGGIDVKYGVTQGLTADFTVNPDFAQVEADEQQVNLVRRRDMRRSFGELRFSPRPQSIGWVRRFVWTGSFAYVENLAGTVETREAIGSFALELDNSDQLYVSGARWYEFLPQPFDIAPGVTLPVRGYDFAAATVEYLFGQQRRLSGTVLAEHGTFYSGHKTTLRITRGRASVSNQFSVEPMYSVDWLDLAEGAFVTHLAGSRVTYTMTPLMFTTALVQYNSSLGAVSANVRFRWEYQPGSELFIVFNEDRDTTTRRFPGLRNRAFIIKFNRLFRF